MKKKLIICTARTGSTNMLGYIRDNENLISLGELFSPKCSIFKRDNSYHDDLIQLRNLDNWVGKLIPYHVITYSKIKNLNPVNVYHDVVSASTDCCYLYRKDFKKQVISLVVANVTKDWSHTRCLTSKLTLPARLFKCTAEDLMQQYYHIKTIFNFHPARMLETNDLSMYNLNPYDQTNLSHYNEFVNVIPDFDIEKEIFNR